MSIPKWGREDREGGERREGAWEGGREGGQEGGRVERVRWAGLGWAGGWEQEWNGKRREGWK